MESINRDEFERAARRIMEMNSRARVALEKTQNREKAEAEPPKEIAEIIEKPQNKGKHTKSLFDIINFKNLKGDKDRTLIAGIMLLLSGEEADEKLLLALLYIML